ncbi:MAG: MFS transporter [Dehalococcoidia bacterium]|nr:MFS transporter [Dehalococcoidia bacterium]
MMQSQADQTPASRGLLMAVAFLCAFIWSGCGFYAFSLFVKPLQDAFTWERGAVMAAFTITFLLSGMLSPLMGTAIHRWGAKKIVIISAIVFGAGLLGLSTINSLLQYYLYSGLMGLGMTGIGPIPASTIITYHFHKKRGIAIGFMSAGVGLGGLAFSPLISSILIPEFGWRMTYIFMAVFSLLSLIILTELAFKSSSNSDSKNGKVKISNNIYAQLHGVTLKQATGTKAFWMIIIVVFFTQLAQVGAIQNQIPYMNDIGFPATLASICLGLIGFASALGKYLFGWLCDHIKANHASFIGIVLQAAGIVILLNIRESSTTAIAIIYALVLGLGTGAWLPTLSMMVSENLGTKDYARIFSVAFLSYAAGTALGPLITSIIFDNSGDYSIAFIVLLAMYIISAPAAMLIREADKACHSGG